MGRRRSGGAAGVDGVPLVRHGALTVLGRRRARRGELGGEELLREELAVELRELQRTGPTAVARAEAAWLAGDHAAVGRRRPGARGRPPPGPRSAQAELGYWLTKAGQAVTPVARASLRPAGGRALAGGGGGLAGGRVPVRARRSPGREPRPAGPAGRPGRAGRPGAAPLARLVRRAAGWASPTFPRDRSGPPGRTRPGSPSGRSRCCGCSARDAPTRSPTGWSCRPARSTATSPPCWPSSASRPGGPRPPGRPTSVSSTSSSVAAGADLGRPPIREIRRAVQPQGQPTGADRAGIEGRRAYRRAN